MRRCASPSLPANCLCRLHASLLMPDCSGFVIFNIERRRRGPHLPALAASPFPLISKNPVETWRTQDQMSRTHASPQTLDPPSASAPLSIRIGPVGVAAGKGGVRSASVRFFKRARLVKQAGRRRDVGSRFDTRFRRSLQGTAARVSPS
jgi:hypothetical protein